MAQKSKTQRPETSSANLVGQYRAIGPAALLAALLCAPKQRVRKPQPARKAA